MGRPRLIGITGGTGSGKTTIVRKISEIIPDFVCIPQDNYYQSAEHVTNDTITSFNFDHPSAFDHGLLHEHLTKLKDNRPVEMPQYDFIRHKRKKETVTIHPRNVIIVEGIMVLTDKKIRDILDLKIFVDTPDDIRFIRRLQRDVEERGRTTGSVIKQYLNVVRPGHEEFIEPTKNHADVIIPEGGFNPAALRLLTSFMKEIAATVSVG